MIQTRQRAIRTKKRQTPNSCALIRSRSHLAHPEVLATGSWGVGVLPTVFPINDVAWFI